jgi:hypothetical protein
MQVHNDSLLRECSQAEGPEVPWPFRHQVVGSSFDDGLGHSLVTYMRDLQIAVMYGCRCTLPVFR